MSAVDQPERVTIDSFADPQRPSNGAGNEFTNAMLTPLLAPECLQLVRASIPTVGSLNIPDYACVFYYYRLPNATTTPNSSYLKAIRLYPSNYVNPSISSVGFTKNRYVNSGSDFVALLNQAAGASGTGVGDNVSYNKLYTASDITFTWNSTTQTITFTGNNAYTYANAGFSDPNVVALLTNNAQTFITAVSGSGSVQTYSVSSTAGIYAGSTVTISNIRDANGTLISGYCGTFTVATVTANTSFTVSGSESSTASFADGRIGRVSSTPNQILTYNFDTTTSWQQQSPRLTLNMKVGYAQTGVNIPDGSFAGGGNNSTYFQNATCANLTGVSVAQNVAVPVDSFPNLVGTQCVYVYSDWSAGFGQGSLRNLLAIIPMNTPQFGVVHYFPTTPAKYYKLPNEIYKMSFSLLDDNAMPYRLPDTANVNLEFQVRYKAIKS